jgi:hypothetical protein
MTSDLVTLGFSGDGSGIATLGFSGSSDVIPTGGDPTVTLGFSGDGSTITTLGFGGVAIIIPPPTQGSLRQAVYSRLASSPAIAALIGARIHFGALPQSIDLADGPALTYMVPSRSYGHVLCGSDGTSSARVQITAHSYRQAASDQLIQAVRDSFQGFVGTIGGLVITACIFDNEVDLPSPPFAGTDQWTYSVAADYQINHRVSLPANLN